MARSNLWLSVQYRVGFTNEPYQTAHREIVNMGNGLPLIPSAQDARQQWVESALLHRLLKGARAQWQADIRPKHPLFVAYAVPSTTGLRVVVPIGDTPAFAAALAMQGNTGSNRPPVDAIALWREKNQIPRLTATSEAFGEVGVECSWNELCAAYETDAQVSLLSRTRLLFNADPILDLPSAERAALSSLLRRIGLFAEPDALNWLFVWHEWILLGRIGAPPRLPDNLLNRLTTEGVGLPPEQLRTLSISTPTRRLGLMSELRVSESRSSRSAFEHSPTAQMEPSLERQIPAVDRPTDTPTMPSDENSPSHVRRYSDLTVTIMRLGTDFSITDDYFVMRFPDRLATALRQTLSTEHGGRSVLAQTMALNNAISAIIPDCVIAGSPFGSSNEERDWLYARHPVDRETIAQLVAAWVIAQQGSSEQTQSTLAQLNLADFVWDPVRASRHSSFSRLSRLIPMAVAARLADATFLIEGRELHFVRCPTDSGAELMSWPPEQVNARRPFSVSISVSILTVPLNHEPCVRLSFGVRRWLPARGSLARGRGYTALFEAPGNPLSFGTAKIRLTGDPQDGGSDGSVPQWDQAVAKVLDAAGWLAQLPDPERLTTEPLTLLESDRPAVLVHGVGMQPAERVSRELPVIDRASLMSWATDVLAPQLEPVTPLPRVRQKVYRALGATKGSIPPAELRSAIGPQLTIELLTRSVSTDQYALERLSERLDVELPRAEALRRAEISVDLGGVTVNIRGGGIGSRLSDPGQAQQPTISLVEVHERSHPRSSATQDTDEKVELRRRLAYSGRLSQFVTLTGPLPQSAHSDGESATRSRVAFAVDDLLAQLGVRPTVLPHPASGTLTRQPALLAIWLAGTGDRGSRNDRQLPIAVLVDPTGQRIMLRTPGSGWLPLHEAMLNIGRGLGLTDRATGASDVPRFIRDSVERAVATHTDTLLLTHAQNLRAAWRPLRNGDLTADVLDFGGDERLPISMLPGLRHVRVRTAEHGETPECYGIKDATVGQPAGLWQYHEPRLFGSTTGKPAIAATTSLSTSKLAPGSRHGRSARLNPRAPVWNERFVELTVAGLQPDDQPVHWAALAHELRNAAPFHTWPTELPWPVHLAAQVSNTYARRGRRT